MNGSNSIAFALRETRLGFRNSTTRLPFLYGKAVLTKCPQATLRVVVDVNGREQHGYSGDCLPPAWFDKSGTRDYRGQIEDMLHVIGLARQAALDIALRPVSFFPCWYEIYRRVHKEGTAQGLNPLLCSFGVSMVERALMDALARSSGMSLAQAFQENIFGVDAGRVYEELRDVAPRQWLPERPLESAYVRQTVGFADPLEVAEIPDGQRLSDGSPQALEEYITRHGIQYFKVKISGQLDQDLDRLRRFAQVVERHRGPDYQLTLDGNEQFASLGQFAAWVDAVRAESALKTLWENLLALEQPLERNVALSESARGIGELAGEVPVILDESDGTLDAFPKAKDLGYRGVSSKNCKGPIKSLLNAGLIWKWNNQGQDSHYIMTGEDLCTVGIIPVQADLCLTALLGLTHVERNGHHYHPGLDYLPQRDREAALQTHSDFYEERHGHVFPRIEQGKMSLASLQCPGFGFAVEPRDEDWIDATDWHYDTLGL